ncbi:Flp family type IVb pilin [Desulfohalobium retbaense]|uniref:Flp/Fap pilin component n=1 Tax=Desulfohalobium retbaense (strain ATCC 49708 / DSM 5692 / JCM 16813 / HR100) TaxID=485915 RepID=C8X1N7_DESRD|nr:Flp family type IVb pilin [Desulfohalobium retbaense]ACV68459.1 Flp/Fap pilin component [Desulfohalobium retbaense DSM 5692]
MLNGLFTFFFDEQGATATEYAIMISLIAVVIIVAVTALGLATNDLFSEAKNEFEKL